MAGLVAETDPFVWAEEANAWAANFTYSAPQSSQGPLPEVYQDQALQVCWRQIALGGYRLAATLNGALGQAAGVRRAAVSLRGASSRDRIGLDLRAANAEEVESAPTY